MEEEPMSRLSAFALLAGTFVALTASSAARPAATHRTGTIAFIRLAKSPGVGGSLFVVHPDGSGLRQLTPEGTMVWPFYAWSPDGRLIAYVDQRQSLWLVRPDGSGRRPVPHSPPRVATLSWSPDGTRIAITTACPKPRCSTLRLYVVPISGGPPVRLPVGKHLDWGVSWSPRGDELYYNGGGIWAIRPDGTDRRRISRLGWVEPWRQGLSADGSQFVFGTSHYSSFGVVNADGSGYHIVSTHAYVEYGEAWSPLGHRILYGGADHRGIYVIDSDGRNNHRVTRDSPPEADWPALAWSPDGGSIVYDAGSGKDTDLYAIGVDGRHKVQLTDTPDIDIDPSWVAG
jgi:Tol biopolymer transport system component